MHTFLKEVTVIYYDEESLLLNHVVETFVCLGNGRVVIPEKFKENKSIVAVCEGEINILNKLGERVHTFDEKVLTSTAA